MLILALGVLAVASPLVAGRWPATLLLRRWRWPVLIWGALAAQIVIIEFDALHGAAPVLHILTYVAALAFLWLNRAVPGALVVGAGALSNGLTIALNGGVLPARAGAVEAAGIDPGSDFANSAVVDDAVLPWLGDVFAWPEPLPLANTFSVGDVLIIVGVAIAAWSGSARLGRSAPDVNQGPGVAPNP
ncbi:DUF5317 domain-containing protein [Demequina litorisediminis]|uniref:DUF5317 domain-containing protein n=1 Tax=Demequina litorisediminis TaxID=1849022 RepID=A0ABQ6ICY6_9MICO|nr:DUF5317 domain-containing protein [Demequina litorisediminis]GMA35712.1 hypothetical protein GCM10025876_19160 [Demequina litorisediminis]